jgi:hypothetical protein
MGLSVEGLSDTDVRSLVLGEIFLSISQIETEMSLIIGHALGMKPFDAIHSIRDLNLDSKIRILESNASRIPIMFETASDRKNFFKELRRVKDLRNGIAHGVIFSDEQGLYFNIPNRGSVERHSSTVPADKASLENALNLTTRIALSLRLGRAAAEVGGEIRVGKEK